jgi:hypothetical protein
MKKPSIKAISNLGSLYNRGLYFFSFGISASASIRFSITYGSLPNGSP